MCITDETMGKIEVALEEFRQLSSNPLFMLKDCFPGLSFIRMSAEDIDEPPFRKLEHYNLYLLDTREHCVKITSDPSCASGVVVAHR